MKMFNGLAIPQTFAEAADPARSVLVVYDVQVGIMRQLGNGDEILDRVLAVLRAARLAGVPVVFTRHMSLPLKLSGSFQLRQGMAWQRVATPEEVRPWFLRDSAGFALVPELDVREDEAIFDKLAMSAFEGTPLAMVIRDLGRQSVVICGIATEIGIEPTVRHATDLGLFPVIVRDACGAGHADAADRTFAQLAFLGDAFLCELADIQGLWTA